MRLVNPQNTQIHDILLVLEGKYIPYGKDLGLRFKLILFVVLYHARESPWGRMMDGFHSSGTCARAANIYLTDMRRKNKLLSVSATCVPVN